MHQRLRTLRIQRGLTLRQISERTGVAISTLHVIEKHEREVTLTTAFKLARFYGMPVADIWRPLFQQICQEARSGTK
jgi:putative transcriptional regulator